jgi:hypothetical protein
MKLPPGFKDLAIQPATEQPGGFIVLVIHIFI